jgi:hypothetical protein
MHFDKLERREFLSALGLTAMPLAVRAQQPAKLPIIGLLGATTPLVESQRGAFRARQGSGYRMSC